MPDTKSPRSRRSFLAAGAKALAVALPVVALLGGGSRKAEAGLFRRRRRARRGGCSGGSCSL